MTSEIYDLADALLALAPWEWMLEDELIAIRHPESGRLDHISIMGGDGNHFALAIYPGADARHRFNLIHEDRFNGIPISHDDRLMLILDTPQLQFSFAERAGLSKPELAAIKKLGRKYRGVWPSFRSFSPGHPPAPASAEECTWLGTAIRQVLEVTPAFRDSCGGETIRSGPGGEEILTREFHDGAWHSIWTPDDQGLPDLACPPPDSFLLEKVRSHPAGLNLEIHFQLLPHPVGPSREKSVFPYLLLVVEPKSGFVIGFAVFSVEETPHAEIINSLPAELLRMCDRHSVRPASFGVASAVLHAMLAPTAAALGIPIHAKKSLPAVNSALKSMPGMMGIR